MSISCVDNVFKVLEMYKINLQILFKITIVLNDSSLLMGYSYIHNHKEGVNQVSSIMIGQKNNIMNV